MISNIAVRTKIIFPMIKYCHGKETYVSVYHCDCINDCKLLTPIQKLQNYFKESHLVLPNKNTGKEKFL